VKSIEVLFTWLWEWKDGHYERKGWNEKPYRMLYHKSFEIITLIRGKDTARAWKKKLKTSFFQSHWLLPYPQNQSFMRKSKETKQVTWWSSYHPGLDKYYQRLAGYGGQSPTFPASHIKHHPQTRWRRAPDWPEYMDYVVQPEMRLVDLSEANLYQELLSLTEQFNQQPDTVDHRQREAPVTVFEIREFIKDPFRIRGPLHSWDVGTCYVELSQALDEYELLQHHRRNLRRKQCTRNRPDYYSDSSTELGANNLAETDLTSDEESVEQQKSQQLVSIRQIKEQMDKVIAQRREKYQRPDLDAGTLKLLEPRLRRLP
jgi:hypothetical protein